MRPEPLWLYRCRTWLHDDAAGWIVAIGWAIWLGTMVFVGVTT